MNSDATEKTERNRIGERLKLVRGTTSQGEYSKLLGVTTNTIGRYERGERTPDIEYVAAFCKATGVNPRWLILGEESMYDAEASQEKPRIKAGDYRNKRLEELPAEVQKSVRKVAKAAQAWRQRRDELPEWAKDHIEELEEELDEARAELLKAKDEAINAQNMALQTLAARADKVAANVMESLKDQSVITTLEGLLEHLKETGTTEVLIVDGKKGTKKQP